MECEEHLTIFLATFSELGFPVVGRLESPATRLVFLGIEVSPVERVLRLPPGKLRGLQKLVEKGLGRKSCSL